MSEVRIPPASTSNRLINSLADQDYQRLRPHLIPVRLPVGLVVYTSQGPIDYAYFPLGSTLSAMTIMNDGTAIEVATIGNEGMVGQVAAVGGRRSPNRMIVQIGDGGLKISAGVLQEEATRSRSLRDALNEYHAAFMAQVSQLVACNGLHRLEQRCCRWLLMSRDRVGTDDIQLTHEYLGIMLGARRASVTDVLRPLKVAGLLSSHRGKMSILDGAGLEARACECYRTIRDEYDRIYRVDGA